MFNNGMGLSGIVLPIIPAYADTSKESSNVAVLQEDVQVVTSGITSGSYEPIIVQKNIPVKWTIQVKEGQINGCNGTIIVPKYNIEKQLVVGDNIIEFTPTESGTIPFSCWMGMIRSKISVIDDLSKVDASVITDANTGNKSSTGGSCCAGGAGANSTSSTTNSSNTSGSNASGLTDNNLLDIKIPTDQVAVAKINSDGTQSVEITYDGKAFTPAVVVVQSGLETVWNIKSSGIDSTNNNLLFPNYNAKLIVQNGNYPIKFKPEQDFDFLTADGTQYGYVKVVTDIKDIDIAAIKKEVADYTPPTAAGQTGASGASCCN